MALSKVLDGSKEEQEVMSMIRQKKQDDSFLWKNYCGYCGGNGDSGGNGGGGGRIGG